MNPAEILPYLAGPSGAAAVLLLWVWTLRRDITELRRANEALQKRVEAGEEAARSAIAVIGALTGRDANGPGR